MAQVVIIFWVLLLTYFPQLRVLESSEKKDEVEKKLTD
jgi:hypothetical protein